MTEWQPIETAPAGEDQFLLACVFEDGSAQLHVGSRWGGGWGSSGLHSYQPIINPSPTHWMPLPSPPGDPA